LWDIQHSTSAGVFAQAQRIQRDNRASRLCVIRTLCQALVDQVSELEFRELMRLLLYDTVVVETLSRTARVDV
jgi:hypothetical protein